MIEVIFFDKSHLFKQVAFQLVINKTILLK